MLHYPETDHPSMDDIIDNQKVYTMELSQTVIDSFKSLKSNILLAKSFISKTNAIDVCMTFRAGDKEYYYMIEYSMSTGSFFYYYRDATGDRHNWIDITYRLKG